MRTAIGDHEGVSNVIFIGGGVHAVVDRCGFAHSRSCAPLCRRRTCRFDDIAVVAPTIEDVFVALLEDEGKRQ